MHWTSFVLGVAIPSVAVVALIAFVVWQAVVAAFQLHEPERDDEYNGLP